MRRATTLLLAALAFLVLAACGGEDEVVDREQFERQVEETQQEVQAQFDRLGEAESAEDLRARANEAAEAIRAEADDLAELEPPEDAREVRDRLVREYRDLADTLEQRAEGLDESDLENAREELEQLRREDIDRIREDLRDAGFELPDL